MNYRHISTLLGKELLHGPRGFILVMVIVAPLLITLVVNLVMGDLFNDQAKLGIAGGGESALLQILQEKPQLQVREYESAEALKSAVSRGAADLGVILPPGFDQTLAGGQKVAVTVYIWGESLARDRTVISSALLQSVNELSHQPEPVSLETVVLGQPVIPWNQRLLPLTVLVAVFFGGLMLPATSLILEKQNRTLQALSVTPATASAIFIAKAILGIILSLAAGLLILFINQSWGNSPLLLALVLILGAIMSSVIGLILGTLLNDMNTLFATWKFGGLLLFGPALIYLFPGLPQWLSYFFPTFYITGPLMDISLNTVSTATYIQIAVAVVIVLLLVLLQKRLILRLAGESTGQTIKAPAIVP